MHTHGFMGEDWGGRQALFNNKINKKHSKYLAIQL